MSRRREQRGTEGVLLLGAHHHIEDRGVLPGPQLVRIARAHQRRKPGSNL
jgi:hypothetical protein